MMKQKLLFLLLMVLPLVASAQCTDCFKKEDSWKFAAGVTLYSNMTYPLEFTNSFHPLEFDFKYKLSDKSILRAGIPVIWKRNIMGSPEVPHLPDKTTTLEQYVADLHSLYNSTYYNPVNVVEYYTSVLGISLGYEYDLPVAKKLNLSGGIDLGYAYQYVYDKYFALGYYSLDANNQTTLFQITYNTGERYDHILNIKPFAGVNYQFQKLMVEANIGYYYSTYFVNQKFQEKNADAYNIIRDASPYNANFTFDLGKLSYNISLFYTF
ncbi:MAG: hypothetical protein QM800_01665 [Paludibacter sp.]